MYVIASLPRLTCLLILLTLVGQTLGQDKITNPDLSIRDRLKNPKPQTNTVPAAAAPRNAAAPQAAAKPGGKKTDPELKPRLETVTTKDGMQLKIGYFPSDKGKKAVPVLLVHEWMGQMSPYTSLALKLQELGFAVALLDIRGHGRSAIKDAEGKPVEVKRATRKDMGVVLQYDLQAARKFLREENDAEKLNLNALTMIGIREGAILAMNWSVNDWNWPSLGNKKQGQDVKAMVLVSPVKSVNGVNADAATRHQAVGRLPVMLVGGGGSDGAEAARLAKLFDRTRVSGKFNSTKPMPVELIRVSARLNNSRLISQAKIAEKICEFIDTNVADKQDTFGWVSRAD